VAGRISRCGPRGRIRALRALAGVSALRFPDLADTLAIAETGDEAALRDAWDLLERLPTINRRRIFGSYGDLARGTLVRDARDLAPPAPIGRAG
jgi:hypothetical protein